MSSTVETLIANNDVVVFWRSGCGFCTRVMQVLDKKGIKYHAHKCSGTCSSVLAKLCGKTSVPQTFVLGRHVGGCNDGPERWQGVVPLANSGKIETAVQTRDPTLLSN